MVRFSLIVIFCVHHTVQSLHQAWPAMPQGTMDAIPASAWAMALGRNHTKTINPKCKMPMMKPVLTDNVKGISAKILGESNLFPAGFPGLQSEFPQIFINGIGISAYPPPILKDPEGNELPNPRRDNWVAAFGQVGDASKNYATGILRQEIQNLKYLYLEVKGVFEGCAEVSFIVGLEEAQMHAEGERLRAAYFQQSYLFFGPQIPVDNGNVVEQCGAENGEPPELPVQNPIANYYRTVGLGEDGGEPFYLGNICEFDAPNLEHDEPFACSIGMDDGRRLMWGPSDHARMNMEDWLFWYCD